MKKIFIFLLLLFPLAVLSQDKSFETFDKTVKEQKGGFNGNKENLSKIFNQERIRLGKNFETELWKYLENDVEKHYWINFFLESKSYLHGNDPLSELAFKVRENALKLLENKTDSRSFGKIFNFRRKQTIYYRLKQMPDLAVKNKHIADDILKSHPEISIYITAISRLDKCLYDNIEKEVSLCVEEASKPVETIVSSGFVTGLAIHLPQPENKGKLKGEVFVKVLISEKGEVISAEAYQGVKELFDVSVEAAKLAKFSPLLLSGKPTKRSGVIVYKL